MTTLTLVEQSGDRRKHVRERSESPVGHAATRAARLGLAMTIR
jgi:hypothetical protein